ncbi:MAG TPA: hypothetical protein VMU30_00750 [Bacteroidota bacterium]|nr:hypothetical protein [Bacteroidota bacterium]
MNTRWFFILSICFFFGCHSIPQDNQRFEQLADTYAAVVQCKAQNKNIDSVHYQQKLEITLKRHGYTKQQFQHDVEALCADPAQFHAFSDLVLKKLQQQ